MDAQLVLDAPDLDVVLAVADEHAQPAAVFGAGLGAGQHQQDVAVAVGDEELHHFQTPLVGLVPVGVQVDRLQGGAGVRLGQGHGAGGRAAGELGQELLLLRLVAELVDGLGDILQAEQVHQRGFGLGDHLDGHGVDGGGEVQSAVLSRQGEAHQLRLGQLVQRLPGARGVADFAILEVAALLIHGGGGGGDDVRRDIPDDLQHLVVVVDGVLIVRGCIVAFFGFRIAVLGDFDNVLNIQIVELKLQVFVVGKEIGHGGLDYFNLCI